MHVFDAVRTTKLSIQRLFTDFMIDGVNGAGQTEVRCDVTAIFGAPAKPAGDAAYRRDHSIDHGRQAIGRIRLPRSHREHRFGGAKRKSSVHCESQSPTRSTSDPRGGTGIGAPEIQPPADVGAYGPTATGAGASAIEEDERQ